MTLHETLARTASGIVAADLGAAARQGLRDTIADTLGCMVAAAAEPFADAAVRAALQAYGAGGCAAVGRGERLSAAAAAMVNGTLGHGYDFDDVHMPSVAHFSTVVIPAALAACQLANAGGPAFLDAVAAGDEVGGRLGWAACSPAWGGTSVRNSGFFPTSALGTLAAAAAAARALSLDTHATAQAIAIAASHASGLACISRGDNSTKRTQAGWAAQAGLCAALLAREGYTGPQAVLETPQGYFEAFTRGHYDPRALDRTANAPWICEEMSFKYYPLEYFIHPLVELAGRAKADRDFSVDSIARIEATVASRFVTLFEPAERKTAPRDRFEALISAPYCIARALSRPGTGDLFLDDFREGYVMDEPLRALAAKVAFVPDPAVDAVFPLHVAARLTLRFSSGRAWSASLDDVYGSPQRPLSAAHLEGKFRQNCAALEPAHRDRLWRTLSALDKQTDASWIRLLRA